MFGGITKSVLFGFLAFGLLRIFNLDHVAPGLYSVLKVLPSYLIIPIFASLGVVNFEKGDKKGLNSLRFAMFLSLLGAVQFSLGFGFGFFLEKFFPHMLPYKTFGYELSQGFAGGHSTAAGVAGIFRQFGVDYWQDAQGVTTAFATIGLLGGIFFGLFLATGKAGVGVFKKNVTKVDGEKVGISDFFACALLVAASSLCGYFFSKFLRFHNVFILKSMPAWSMALIFSYIFSGFLKLTGCNLSKLKKSRSIISGVFSEIAVFISIAVMKVEIIVNNLSQIMILSLLGFLATYVLCFICLPKFFPQNSGNFQRGLISFGANTGVVITGILLLKASSSPKENTVLTEFSAGFSLMCILTTLLSPITFFLLESGTLFANFAFSAFTGVVDLIFLFFLRKKGNF